MVKILAGIAVLLVVGGALNVVVFRKPAEAAKQDESSAPVRATAAIERGPPGQHANPRDQEPNHATGPANLRLQNAVQRQNLPLLGTWQFDGTAVWEGTRHTWGGNLVFTKNIDSLTNECYWDTESTANGGQIYFRCTFDPSTKILRMVPYQLDNPKGTVRPAVFWAELSDDGKRLFNGYCNDKGEPPWVGPCIPISWTATWKSKN